MAPPSKFGITYLKKDGDFFFEKKIINVTQAGLKAELDKFTETNQVPLPTHTPTITDKKHLTTV